jgi:DUF971 family protein
MHCPDSDSNPPPWRTKLPDQISIAKVGLYGEKILIRWNDGHESSYGAREVRISCQCAECVEEWSKRQLLDPASVPNDLKAEDHLMIGNYAIQFLWSDAHYTGIFPFDVLRSLCPCTTCKNTREEKTSYN